MLPVRDNQLVQIINAALADTAQRSGKWLACRPGCTQCCIGAFAISLLDAERLRSGMERLEIDDPQRATRIRQRAQAYVARIAATFPGDAQSGLLAESPEASEQFEEFANDEACPALDPETGMCDVYASRPMTCRIFGPPVRSEDGLGVCELCYHGASNEEIASCEMRLETGELEAQLTAEVEASTGLRGNTIVAFALLQ
jgi:Fe-S-cluster containining protein